ncbi:MAG: uroporphyrinogen-III synthase [Gammaproteobacteria bacterium]|nr:uroporphyrinogen-III synthase [Gammaproteobacteria bacterium]
MSGAGILVTRAAHQAEPLCRLISAYEGNPIKFPALEITPPADPERAQGLLKTADRFDLIVFISPNAVGEAMKLLPEGGFHPGARIAAVGQGTARRLSAAGYSLVTAPTERFDSESLLAIDELVNAKGKQILIVRGQGGRGLLGDTLIARGATVTYAEVYRRRCPDTDATPLLLSWESSIDLVTVTSLDILENLISMLGIEGATRLRNTPLIVVSERLSERALKFGCQQVRVARRADDLSVIDAVCDMIDKTDVLP